MTRDEIESKIGRLRELAAEGSAIADSFWHLPLDLHRAQLGAVLGDPDVHAATVAAHAAAAQDTWLRHKPAGLTTEPEELYQALGSIALAWTTLSAALLGTDPEQIAAVARAGAKALQDLPLQQVSEARP